LQNQDFYLHEDRLLQGGSNAQLKVSKGSDWLWLFFSHNALAKWRQLHIFVGVNS
jgi:hypothetical protein